MYELKRKLWAIKRETSKSLFIIFDYVKIMKRHNYSWKLSERQLQNTNAQKQK